VAHFLVRVFKLPEDTTINEDWVKQEARDFMTGTCWMIQGMRLDDIVLEIG
jgi:hypothetical protein